MAKHVIDPAFPHLGGNIEGGDPYTFYPDLWKWFVEDVGVRTVLDVGCGEGHALDAFAKLGCQVLGLDGLEANVAKCERPAVVHDMCDGPFLIKNMVNLVWCCEVVEHVEEIFLDHLLRTLCQGSYVAITHALPGQRGVHHVNCQPTEYWVSQFRRMGYEYHEHLTSLSKERVPNPDHHWRRSGMIFVSA